MAGLGNKLNPNSMVLTDRGYVSAAEAEYQHNRGTLNIIGRDGKAVNSQELVLNSLEPSNQQRIQGDLASLIGMPALQAGDLYKEFGGFGSTLDNRTGIQSSQEMFNETYAEALANEAMANVLETQGVPDVVPFTVEDALKNVIVSNGIDEFEANYVKGLLDQGLVTISDVAQQTGIPEQDIQNTYNQMSGRPLFDVLNDLTNTLRTDDGFVAGNAPVFTTGDTQIKNVGDEYYDQFTQEELAAMQAANASVLDVPLNVAQGALMGTEMLTNVAGADNVASRTLGEWQDVLGGMMSEQSKLDKAEISRIMSEAEGQGWYEEMKAAAEAFGVAPIDFVTNALGTTLPVIAATAVTGGGILPATAVGAATGIGTAKGAIYDATKQEMLNQGMSIEDAERIASDAQSYGGENLDEILISGGFGALAGSTGVEASVSRILQGIGKGGTATVVKGAAGEALGEMGEGGAEQYAANKALQEIGVDINEFQGVVGNAVLEGLAGAATGGGISAFETTEGGTEGIADTNVNSQILKDFNNAYQNELENISGSNVENLASTGLENELNSNDLGSSITGTEDTSGAATRDLSTSPKNVNEVTESEISEIESAIEESGLTTTQTTTQTTAQQNANTVTGLATVANKATALFGFGAAAIAAVVYAANKSGASAQDVAAATNLSVDQVNKLANEAGQTINNQGGSTVDVGQDTVNTLVGDKITKTKGSADTTTDTTTLTDVITNTNAATSITNTVDTSLSTGNDINSTVDSTVSTAINNGVDTSTAVDSSVSSSVSTAINSGADTSTVIDSAVNSAINSTANANGNVNSAINSAVNSSINSAVNSGVNVNAATNAAVNAAINAATNAGVNINTATNIANNAATNANTNINNNVNTNVNTNVNENVNENINTNLNPNFNPNVNINTNINQEVPDPERQKENERQGLMMLIQQTPVTESILFKPRFTKLENVQQGMFDAFLRAAGGNR